MGNKPSYTIIQKGYGDFDHVKDQNTGKQYIQANRTISPRFRQGEVLEWNPKYHTSEVYGK
jgi:hypothetical protein